MVYPFTLTVFPLTIGFLVSKKNLTHDPDRRHPPFIQCPAGFEPAYNGVADHSNRPLCQGHIRRERVPTSHSPKGTCLAGRCICQFCHHVRRRTHDSNVQVLSDQRFSRPPPHHPDMRHNTPDPTRTGILRLRTGNHYH